MSQAVQWRDNKYCHSTHRRPSAAELACRFCSTLCWESACRLTQSITLCRRNNKQKQTNKQVVDIKNWKCRYLSNWETDFFKSLGLPGRLRYLLRFLVFLLRNTQSAPSRLLLPAHTHVLHLDREKESHSVLVKQQQHSASCNISTLYANNNLGIRYY